MANERTGLGLRSRLVLWGGVAAILLAPAIAAQFTDDVAWGPMDFALAGGLLVLVGLVFEMTADRSIAFRAAFGVAAITTLGLVWLNASVGIIGNEGNPANLMFAGVLAIALGGAMLARFRSRKMAGVLVWAAVAQFFAGATALTMGWGSDGARYPYDIIGCTGAFTAAWLLAAALFRIDAKRHRKL
jgi:hypothetical protein